MIGISEVVGYPAQAPGTVVFVHAHPDDEAIFTGGTLAALARAGHRTVVILATSGELGERDPADRHVGHLAARRRAEAQASCDLLGVHRLVFLDHIDSGLEATAVRRPWGAFVDVPLDTVARQIADILVEERAEAIVTYDDHGVYGHPDHIHVHDTAQRAADLAGVATRYLATVDREYLHFVESHLVDHAGDAVPSIRPVGSATVEITTTVAIHQDLDAKQRAIAAHASQVGADPWLGVPDSFAEVYGYEWYVRVGPRGALDALSSVPEDSILHDDAGTGTGTSTSTAPADRHAAVVPTLDPAELAVVAEGLATVARHSPLPAADPHERRWWRLLATDDFDAWLIAWPTGGAVTPHDHGGSTGAFAVVAGELTEVTFATGVDVTGADVTGVDVIGVGAARAVPADAVHDVVNASSAPALSVHVYSPPLSSMAYYDDGGADRMRVESVDEEAPLWRAPGVVDRSARRRAGVTP